MLSTSDLSWFGKFREGFPVRCTKCHRMQRPNTLMVMVSSSAHFFDEDWQSLINGAMGGSQSGWCLDCVEKVKNKTASLTGV